MLCGAVYLHLFAGHVTMFCAIAWTPLVFLALEKVVDSRELGWVLAGMAAFSLQLLAGHPQVFLYCAGLGLIYVFFNLWNNPHWKESLGLVLLVYLGVVGLTAVQLGAGWEALRECTLGSMLPYNYIASFSLPPEALLKTIFPDFFEKFGLFKYGRPENFWETTSYIGTIGLI